ncbi:hypothetical protein K437DRAFT_294299 [Tilletiaria anomala UBC 951]|uniref:Zn(2)-C6 fungal-type domain-containing protein n=1 Tax=Tilletiaria anomala (strain ATCC 24038 / CBS 436.72 / UBC 951) TaxID=1037660 RepID=A0A066VXN0_TILAU|nr:uncharacterized protein K437DRAFT_294299 [Tilletiaria anomala UBC 951]KDN46467.1 hypothetical protein K437DRAFT_294299 [Tilletiaria anomala UBC 951]
MAEPLRWGHAAEDEDGLQAFEVSHDADANLGYDALARPGQSGSSVDALYAGVKRHADANANEADDSAASQAKRLRSLAMLNWLPRGGKKNSVRDTYARVSCEACRKKKSRCVLQEGIVPSPEPLIGDERCGRCVKLNLVCVVWAESRRKDLEALAKDGIDVSATGTGRAHYLDVLKRAHGPEDPVARGNSRDRGSAGGSCNAACAVGVGGSTAPQPQWPPPMRSHAVPSTAVDGALARRTPARSLEAANEVSIRTSAAVADQDANEEARALYPAGTLQVFRPFDDDGGAFAANSLGHAPPPPPPPAPGAPDSDPAPGVSVNGTAALPREPTILARAASLLGNPYSLFSQFCYQQPGFASNLQGRKSVGGIGSGQVQLDLLALVDDELHANFKSALQPYLLFVPHLFSVTHVRSKVAENPTPSARLLLATLYYLAMRSSLSSRNMLLSQAQGVPSHRAPTVRTKAAAKETETPSFEHRMLTLQNHLRVIIRTNAEDVLLSFNAGRDDYAVHALELLACYHPLALERVSGTTPDHAYENVPTLGEELISAAKMTATRLRYKARSTASVSLVYWTLSLGSENAFLGMESSKFLGISSEDMEEDSGALEQFFNSRPSSQAEASPVRVTRGAQAKARAKAYEATDSTMPIVSFKQNLRIAGRIALAGRLEIIGLQNKAIQDVRQLQIQFNNPTQPLQELSREVHRVMDDMLERIDKARERTMSELRDHGANIEDPDRIFQYSARSLLVALQLEALQAALTLTGVCASIALRVDLTGAVHSSSMSVLAKAKRADAALSAMLSRVGALRGKQLYHMLALIPHLMESSAIEAVPIPQICAATVSAAKVAMEEVAAKILGWKHKPDDMDTLISLLNEAAAKLAGFDGLSASGRKQMYTFGIQEGDLRVTSSAVVLSFSRALKQWRNRLLDDLLPMKPPVAQHMPPQHALQPPQHLPDQQHLAWGEAMGIPPQIPADPLFAADGRDPLLESLFSDEPDWAAIFHALQA